MEQNAFMLHPSTPSCRNGSDSVLGRKKEEGINGIETSLGLENNQSVPSDLIYSHLAQPSKYFSSHSFDLYSHFYLSQYPPFSIKKYAERTSNRLDCV